MGPEKPLKLYGSAMSYARVLTVILEKDLPYEHIMIDISRGEQGSEEYLKLQPFGKVPVLDDNGFVVYESRAICRYLARKYDSGTRLMPDTDDYEAYARFEQACSIEQSYFAAACEYVGTELVIRPKKGLGPPDMARVNQGLAEFETCLAVYETILSKQKYIAGDELTLADLFHLANGTAMMQFYRPTFEKFPNVLRWFEGLQRRESWAKASSVWAMTHM